MLSGRGRGKLLRQLLSPSPFPPFIGGVERFMGCLIFLLSNNAKRCTYSNQCTHGGTSHVDFAWNVTDWKNENACYFLLFLHSALLTSILYFLTSAAMTIRLGHCMQVRDFL